VLEIIAKKLLVVETLERDEYEKLLEGQGIFLKKYSPDNIAEEEVTIGEDLSK